MASVMVVVVVVVVVGGDIRDRAGTSTSYSGLQCNDASLHQLHGGHLASEELVIAPELVL